MSDQSATLLLSLDNTELYDGCDVQEIAGRLTLMTPPSQAVNIIGRNARLIVERMVASGVEEVTLTGAMAIWAYLVVFHSAVQRFRAVYYDDGKPGGRLLVAAHP